MMTEKFITDIDAILLKRGQALLKAQHQISSVYYLSRSGQLREMTGKQPQVSNGTMKIWYPLHIRLLDLKKGRGGRKKKNYEPIYNKYVYGYIMGGLYNQLSRGISGDIRINIQKSLSK